jgi:hypothetical protein
MAGEAAIRVRLMTRRFVLKIFECSIVPSHFLVCRQLESGRGFIPRA